ncbi:MAG: hypothetical protein M1416_03130 [Candidatus Pacearchaeota archaeon]|nr:hypothetical protein [Candidatus Pacearchaeota archaeon]
MQKPRKFCDNQYEAKEDIGTEHYSCLGHLHEGRVLECHCQEQGITQDENSQFQIIINGYKCQDFQILPEVKQDLTKKLNQ